MKNFIKSIHVVGLLFFLPFITVAQQTDSDLNRTIELNGSTDQKTITITVEPGTVHLDIKIRSILEEGQLRVEIYDPNGEKQGTLSATSDPSSDSVREKVEGRLNKIAKDPMPGEWTVRLQYMDAHGRVQLMSKLRL